MQIVNERGDDLAGADKKHVVINMLLLVAKQVAYHDVDGSESKSLQFQETVSEMVPNLIETLLMADKQQLSLSAAHAARTCCFPKRTTKAKRAASRAKGKS